MIRPRRVSTNLAAAMCLAFATLSCDRGDAPAATMARADEAFRDRRFADALAAYERVADGSSRPASTDHRLHAARRAAETLARLGRYDDALARFDALYATFPDAMAAPDAYKHALVVIEALQRSGASDADLQRALAIADARHPRLAQEFDRFVARLVESRHGSVVDEFSNTCCSVSAPRRLTLTELHRPITFRGRVEAAPSLSEGDPWLLFRFRRPSGELVQESVVSNRDAFDVELAEEGPLVLDVLEGGERPLIEGYAFTATAETDAAHVLRP